MISVENRVGRLMEVRFASPFVAADFEQYAQDRRRISASLKGERIVVGDFSRSNVMPPELADSLTASRNGVAEPLRNALLVPAERATLAMQIERIIREANNPMRRAFRSRDVLCAWLGEILTPPELKRLWEFLAAD